MYHAFAFALLTIYTLGGGVVTLAVFLGRIILGIGVSKVVGLISAGLFVIGFLMLILHSVLFS